MEANPNPNIEMQHVEGTILRISRFDEDDPKKKRYGVQLDNNEWYNSFGVPRPEVVEGAFAKIDYKDDSFGHKLKGISITIPGTGQQLTPSTPQAPQRNFSAERDKRITKSFVLKSAIAYVSTLEPAQKTIEKVIESADRFKEWLEK